MKRPTSFLLSQFGRHPGRKKPSVTQGAADFLRAHDRMAALMPAVSRMNELQRDCAAILPALFGPCSVMRFEAGQLVLATQNAAIATKLKQQLPKLQDGLLKRGWQVSAIRIKVQVGNISEITTKTKQLALPSAALSALEQLNEELEDSATNATLKAALATMLRRHRHPG